MSYLVLKQGTFDLDFEVRESDPHSRKVLVRMNRVVNGKKQHISDMFLSTDQVNELGSFLKTTATDIAVDQAQEDYLATADTQSTR